MNGPNKLEFSLHSAGKACQYSSLLGPLLSYKENEVLFIWLSGPYSQHFFFFVNDEWAQKARVLHYSEVEKACQGKYFSLLGPLISYKENEALFIWLSRPYSQHFIFFVNDEWAQKARVLHYSDVEKACQG